jgi:hypothetical protein
MRIKPVMVVGGIILLQILLIIALSRRQSTSPDRTVVSSAQLASAADATRKRLSETRPSRQRTRTDEFVEFVAGLQDIDACSRALHAPTNSDGTDLTQLAGVLGSGGGGIGYAGAPFLECVADRRGARLAEFLNTLSSSGKSTALDSIFEAKLKQHVTCWDRKFNWFRNEVVGKWHGPVPTIVFARMHRNDIDMQGDLHIPGGPYESVPANFHALSLILFLSALYDTPADFGTKYDRWIDALRPISEQINADPNMAPMWSGFSSYGLPEGLSAVNLMLVAATRDMEIEEAVDTVSGWPELSSLQIAPRKWYRWDAPVNDLDFSHMMEFQPAEADFVVREFPTVARWLGPDPPREKQDEIIHALRRRLK